MYIEILPTLRNEKHSADLVKKYFAKDDGRFRYSGAYFEHLGGGGDRPEVAYQITADDLLAAKPVLADAPDRERAVGGCVTGGSGVQGSRSSWPCS